MRTLFLFALTVTMALLVGTMSVAQGTDKETLARLSTRFSRFLTLGDPARVIYADAGQHVHVYRLKDGEPELDWETTGLGSPAVALISKDVDGDGRKEIVVATSGGRIVFYDAESYAPVWENLQEPFENIECMVSENVDGDPQDELIFIADSHLYFYDSLEKSLEWKSPREFTAQEMVLGNLDDDEQLEIILNTGVVLDTRFYTVDFESAIRFGERIDLMDFNGDGMPEVVGEASDSMLRIFDIYAERELW